MELFRDAPMECDPSGRYLRYNHLLGRGACKRVFKACDQLEGIEVAWNQVVLTSHMGDAERERMFAEIRVLERLTHKNIITFHHWWHDAGRQTVNFITELFTDGTLRQYRKKHRHIGEQVLKRWAYQVLDGLAYLHAHIPPIIHRDLKCDNILVNGTSGVVKLADLGLASVVAKGQAVVGTPEFMAPEVYDEAYDEKVDVYSFGMCMLELATLEYPYAECRSIPAIFRKVSQGIPPAALAKVPPGALRTFIEQCISYAPESRPSALELLKHPFFDSLRSETDGSPTLRSFAGSFFSPSSSCASLTRLGTSSSGPSSPKAAPLNAALCGKLAAKAAAAAAAAAAGEGAGAGAVGAGGGEDELIKAGLAPRTCSVCVAQLRRQEHSTLCLEGASSSAEEDSDEEVLIPLEDALAPDSEDEGEAEALLARCSDTAAAVVRALRGAAAHGDAGGNGGAGGRPGGAHGDAPQLHRDGSGSFSNVASSAVIAHACGGGRQAPGACGLPGAAAAWLVAQPAPRACSWQGGGAVAVPGGRDPALLHPSSMPPASHASAGVSSLLWLPSGAVLPLSPLLEKAVTRTWHRRGRSDLSVTADDISCFRVSSVVAAAESAAGGLAAAPSCRSGPPMTTAAIAAAAGAEHVAPPAVRVTSGSRPLLRSLSLIRCVSLNSMQTPPTVNETDSGGSDGASAATSDDGAGQAPPACACSELRQCSASAKAGSSSGASDECCTSRGLASASSAEEPSLQPVPLPTLEEIAQVIASTPLVMGHMLVRRKWARLAAPSSGPRALEAAHHGRSNTM